LLGASGSFFWPFGGGMTLGSFLGSFWANAMTGTAVMTAAARIAIRQVRACGNLRAMREV
jgi:hypothetical protein